ncbi:MAG TPA: twin-arginine translocase TatA/TatE family subunit [Anaeromyxobacter sp.]|nr:twin-arginine translocase TatA/TatE family subunit [Anaeromyxobacter sp.]
MGELGMGELLVILVLVVVLFGGSKLPQVGASLGKAIRNFKDAASGTDEKPGPSAEAKALPKPSETQPPSGDSSKEPPRDPPPGGVARA